MVRNCDASAASQKEQRKRQKQFHGLLIGESHFMLKLNFTTAMDGNDVSVILESMEAQLTLLLALIAALRGRLMCQRERPDDGEKVLKLRLIQGGKGREDTAH
jgi:hypothetical protein